MTLTTRLSNPLDRVLHDMSLEEMIWFEALLMEATDLGVRVGIILAIALSLLAALTIGMVYLNV